MIDEHATASYVVGKVNLSLISEGYVDLGQVNLG